jgi:5'-3' exonuclease
MILIDNTQILIASIFSQYKNMNDVSEDVIRHIVINTYRMYRTRFKEEYGDLVICQDSANPWRREIFPQYKANRKKAHDKDKEQWDKIFEVLTKIRQEVMENFPFKNMRVDRCEADDIIATLAKNFHQHEKILIVSSDKDFQQLQRFPNIYQFSPIHKDFLKCENPQKHLFEHILRGDTGDGVPNILSDDDTFVDDAKRQKPLSSRKITNWAFYGVPSEHERNYDRNKNLVDLAYIPEEIEQNILNEYALPYAGNKGKVFDYLVKNNMKLILESVDELI